MALPEILTLTQAPVTGDDSESELRWVLKTKIEEGRSGNAKSGDGYL